MEQIKQSFSGVQGQLNQLPIKIDSVVSKQNLAVQTAYQTLQGSTSGLFGGYIMGVIFSSVQNQPTPGMNPQQQEQLKKMSTLTQGGPWSQAKNFAVITGVQQGLSFALKKVRGVEDLQGIATAAFGSGVAYGLVSGQGSQSLTIGLAFALFQGIFFKIGAMKPFGNKEPDTEYLRGTYVCETLGLGKYASKLKKQLLTDRTIMLWNDGALRDAGIPAGARLMILHHLDTIKKQFPNKGIHDVLSPALPLATVK